MIAITRHKYFATFAAMVALLASAGAGDSSREAWHDQTLAPDVRAKALMRAMTLDEKISLVHTHVGIAYGGKPRPPGALGSAAIGAGVPRLGIPAAQETDAGLGIANPEHEARLSDVTAMPSGLSLGATFDPALARAAGAAIGAEARAKGFSILLAGGANLIRDPRNGRNFEYVSEDPLLTGRMAGSSIAGVQSQGVVSTLKHFAVNDQETGRIVLSADIGEGPARESDLLAFQIAIETGHPGAVMTAYNKINGVYASENLPLLTILKQDWHYPGWVMSDWGAVHSTVTAARAGLDQQSGEEFDGRSYFGDPLRRAVIKGDVPPERLDDMVTRLLRSNFAVGTFDKPPQVEGPIDRKAHQDLAQTIAEQGIVLLKNDGDLLPLNRDPRRVVVIGAHADRGVLTGGGSSQVLASGTEPFATEQPQHAVMGIKYYDASSPLDAIRKQVPAADVRFVDGHDPSVAAGAARDADVAIVFVEQWMGETHDAPNLSLPSGQDALVAAVATANPKTIVILETGGAVKMPWIAAVPVVLEAWYAGARGGDAIAALLFGATAPAGRLPLTFPKDDAQLPRPSLHEADSRDANPGLPIKGGFDIDYDTEGSDVGYRWFARKAETPLFPFGYGLTYTHFAYDRLAVTTHGSEVKASVEVCNVGAKSGTEVVQFYADAPEGRFPRRLVGWARLTLRPGERARADTTVDPRLLARYDAAGHRWTIAAGRYTVSARPYATGAGPEEKVAIQAALLRP